MGKGLKHDEHRRWVVGIEGVMMVMFFFFKQKTAYEIGTGDWSSDVCSSDLKGSCKNDCRSGLVNAKTPWLMLESQSLVC